LYLALSFLIFHTLSGPDPSNVIPGVTSTNTPAPVANVAVPDPSNILPGGTSTNTPAPVANVAVPGPSNILPGGTSTIAPAPVSNVAVPDPSNILPGGITTDTPAPLHNVAPILMVDNTHLQTPSQEATALHQKLQAAKLKLNVALLHQKLQEAKARLLNMVPAGNIGDKEHPPIAKIVANEAKVTEQLQNEAVHEPTVSAHPQVLIKRE
jgi:hypothetical protein